MGIFNRVSDWVQNKTQVTAEKCRKVQSKSMNKILEDRLANKISEINGRIEYVVQSFEYESTVIYALDYFGDLYEKLKDYYSIHGFNFTKVEVPELNKTYVIISWN